MCKHLLTAIMHLGSPKIFVVGDFMLDIYVYGNVLRISPEAPVPILKVDKTEYRPGGAGSVTTNLVALGASTNCLGAVGNDSSGELLRKLILQMGIEADNLFIVNGLTTITKQRIIGIAQNRHHQQLVRIDQEYFPGSFQSIQKKIFDAYRRDIEQVDIVCLQDHNKGLFSSSFCPQLIKIAKTANKKIIIDPALISDYSRYKGATLITPNRKEASSAVGFDIQTSDDVIQAAEKLIDEQELEAVLITLDRDGAYLKTQNTNKFILANVRDVYDITGAGDMILAVFALAVASGYDYEIAADLAVVASGVEVGKFGSQPVSPYEIIEAIFVNNDDTNSKLCSTNFIVDRAKWYHNQKKKITFVIGCFDVINNSCIKFLKSCKRQGGVVIIGLISDRTITKKNNLKGLVNTEDDRAVTIAAFEMVDCVIILDTVEIPRLIKEIKPDTLINFEERSSFSHSLL